MTEKRSARLGPKSGGTTRTTTMARPPETRSSGADADYVRIPKSSSPILKRSRDFSSLAIQLSIDPLIKSIWYLDSLPAKGGDVTVEMLVAERNDGQCYAYDLVHERPPRDLDHEGLLLLTLEANNIRLVEVDQYWINAEPRAGNYLMIWKNKRYPVDDATRAAIERTLKKQGPIAIWKLAEIVEVPYPLKSVCALAWAGIVAVDLSEQLDLNSEVSVAKSINQRRPANSAPSPSKRGP